MVWGSGLGSPKSSEPLKPKPTRPTRNSKACNIKEFDILQNPRPLLKGTIEIPVKGTLIVAHKACKQAQFQECEAALEKATTEVFAGPKP